MADKTYLELSEEDGGAHKFWEVTVDGADVTVRYGRIGDDGRATTKTYGSDEEAQADAAKKIKSKKKKGYEEAVQGVRQKRSVTRRTITSTKSTASVAPTMWRFESGSSAFGIFVDAESCWVGNEGGELYRLTPGGEVKRKFKLPDGVKCIVADEEWLYAGCDDGNVYDLTGKAPRVAYEIDENVDIYWVDIADGILGISDSKGNVFAVNHEDETQWSKQSVGRSGWMVRCDDVGVYHGHSGGVTKYDWEAGTKQWHADTQGAVLFGWQTGDELFVGTTKNAVQRISKGGKVAATYACDASVFCCASSPDGELIFAGDNHSSLYCFARGGDRMWKFDTERGSAFSMQYFDDKLYVVTTEGTLIAIDVSGVAIQKAQAGEVPKVVDVKASAAVEEEVGEAGEELEVTNEVGSGVVVECFKKGSKLRIRAASAGYDSTWRVQFPKDIRVEGAKYVVAELKKATQGDFYRAIGPIKRLEI